MFIKKLLKPLMLLVCAAVLASGCARDIRSNFYTSDSVGGVSTVYEGTVKSVRVVTVSKGDELEQNATGGILGGVAGGFIGSTIGKGSGQDLATVGGALLGATAGALAEKELKTQQAYEYTVKLSDGSLVSVVQGLDASYSVGQRVLVHMSPNGRSRITAY